MNVTEKDREIMCRLHDNFEKVVSENVELCFDYIILPIGIYLGCNKGEVLDIYKDFKGKGRKVYFVSDEGMWLLNNKGEIELGK